MKGKIAIIAGVSGQVGQYFARALLDKGLQVIGVIKNKDCGRDHWITGKSEMKVEIDSGLKDFYVTLINLYKPDYFINCAALSHVASAHTHPEEVFAFNTNIVIRQLEAIKQANLSTRYLNFGSAEEFGEVVYSPQDELHPLHPTNIYGASKVATRCIIETYRKNYAVYAVQCWTYNTESCLRSPNFITRKVTSAAARIATALKRAEPFEPLATGNFSASRDWSHAIDTVDAGWRLLNQEIFNPVLVGSKNLHQEINDYVVASGVSHTIKELIEVSFRFAKIEGKWEGEGLEEKYVRDGKVLVLLDPKFFRASDKNVLRGNSARIREELEWSTFIDFEEIIHSMVENDLRLVRYYLD